MLAKCIIFLKKFNNNIDIGRLLSYNITNILANCQYECGGERLEQASCIQKANRR